MKSGKNAAEGDSDESKEAGLREKPGIQTDGKFRRLAGGCQHPNEKWRRPVRDQNPECRRHEGKKDALCHQLLEYSRAPGSERDADCDLPLSGSSLREKPVGGIRTRKEQNHSRQNHHELKRSPVLLAEGGNTAAGRRALDLHASQKPVNHGFWCSWRSVQTNIFQHYLVDYGLHGRSRPIDAHARTQAAHGLQPEEMIVPEALQRLRSNASPDINEFPDLNAKKRLGRDSDDLERLVVDPEFGSECRGASVESFPPEAIADHRYGMLTWLPVIAGGDEPPEDGSHTKNLKIISGNRLLIELLITSPIQADNLRLRRFVCHEIGKRADLLAHLEIGRVGSWPLPMDRR